LLYNDIHIYNIAATKELDILLQAQQTEINEQKTRIQELEIENTTIKNALNQILSEAGKPTI
jgi:cell shape-determining protein MreC